MNKVKHAFTSPKADGADATLIRPSNWNADHPAGIELTNRTGGALASGDVVGLSAANDESVILADTADTTVALVVAMEAINNLSAGLFTSVGAWTVKVAAAVTRGNYLAKSATSKALYDTGVAAATNVPPSGAVAIALTSAAGAGTVVGFLLTSGGAGGGFSKGADLASAATLAIPSSGSYFHVTGTTNITALASRPAGHVVVLRFAGVLSIVHDAATLILRGGGDYQTQADDVLWFVSEGSGNWRQIAPQHASLGNERYVKGRTVQDEADFNLLGIDSEDRSVLGHGTPTSTTQLNGALVGGELTVTVDSTAGFPKSGTAIIGASDFFTYTGKTATTFTGCSGVGAASDNTAVVSVPQNIRVNGQLRCDIDSGSRFVLPVGSNKWAV